MSEMIMSMSVVTDKKEDALRVMEAFSRVASGLAMEGLMVSISVSPSEEEVSPDA
jgi:hypothetical protein